MVFLFFFFFFFPESQGACSSVCQEKKQQISVVIFKPRTVIQLGSLVPLSPERGLPGLFQILPSSKSSDIGSLLPLQ
jgi:hypothetical protein